MYGYQAIAFFFYRFVGIYKSSRGFPTGFEEIPRPSPTFGQSNLLTEIATARNFNPLPLESNSELIHLSQFYQQTKTLLFLQNLGLLLTKANF